MRPARERDAASGDGLTTLDLVSALADSPRRPLDFSVVLHLRKAPPADALRAGARSASRRYPASGCTTDGRHWTRAPGSPSVAVAPAGAEPSSAIEAFVDVPFDLRREPPVRQLLLPRPSGSGALLVTRFHHAVCDGLGALMWLGHQLDVAWGLAEPVVEVGAIEPVTLRHHPGPMRRSRFAYGGPCDRLWTRSAEASRARRWHTFHVPASPLRDSLEAQAAITYSDVLATCLLEVLVAWNREHDPARFFRVGLWLPVNIREDPFVGFGNGTSRIRVYARYDAAHSLVEKCRVIRQQIAWCKADGEWAVPERHPLTRLPRALGEPLIRAYLGRPWADVGTAVFTHIERWGLPPSAWQDDVERVELIGQLHDRYALGLSGTTHRDETWLTFTFDPARVTHGDIEGLAARFRDMLARAQRELS